MKVVAGDGQARTRRI